MSTRLFEYLQDPSRISEEAKSLAVRDAQFVDGILRINGLPAPEVYVEYPGTFGLPSVVVKVREDVKVAFECEYPVRPAERSAALILELRHLGWKVPEP